MHPIAIKEFTAKILVHANDHGNSPQVHPIPIKEFTGKSFGTARRSFAGPTTLIGIMRLGMNPPDDTIIAPSTLTPTYRPSSAIMGDLENPA
eukprot:gene3668-13741_t